LTKILISICFNYMRLLILLLIGMILISHQSWGGMIKEPNVAGAFYSADPKELSDAIDS